MRFPFQIPDTADFDAVGFGTNAVDHLISVPAYPAFNSKVELTCYTLAAGGEAASTMAGLKRLGLQTAYAGRFGDDPAGSLGIESLEAEGVDVKYVETIKDAQSQIAFIIIDAASGERTIIWHRDTKLAYSAEDAPLEIAVRGRVLHMTPHDTAACIAMAKAARENGVVVTIDIDNNFADIESLLPFVDVCMASTDFVQKLLGVSDKTEALRTIKRNFGCPVTGMTLGVEGSLFLSGDKFIETPGFPVAGGCVDTTGAGDAFRTGFLFGMLTGQEVEECARMANAVASLKCRGIGARSSLPNLDELMSMLRASKY